jgi:hypothetical protein
LAAFDPWDTHLETITAKLDQMTDGKVRGRVVLLQEDGWIVEFRGAGRSITVQFGHPGLPDVMPGDYGRAIIYGCDYQPLGNEGRPVGFGKTLTLREGFKWDEEGIREVVLEAVGVLRYVLKVEDVEQVEYQDHSKQGPIVAAKSAVQRRRK